MLLNKAETLPDFFIAFDYIYVEGKGATDSWNWKSSITPTQEKVCLEHESWLFLEMGTGRAPNGRSAWLLPWTTWKVIEKNLEDLGFASIIYEGTERSRNPVAGSVLLGYELEWLDGSWSIPEHHQFFNAHPNLINQAMKFKENGNDGSAVGQFFAETSSED
jgi:hypothetical protein